MPAHGRPGLLTVDPIPGGPSDTLGVFPLPGTVFFPHTLLPLHVFEPRYCRLVEDVRDVGGWIAVPLSAPDRGGVPAFQAMAGAGPISQWEPLPDGRFHIVIDGQARVHLSEVESDAPYRMAAVTPEPEDETWLRSDAARPSMARMLEVAHLLGLAEADADILALVDEPTTRRILVNRFAMVTPMETWERQALLELSDYHERVEGILDQLTLTHRIQETVRNTEAPRDPGLN